MSDNLENENPSEEKEIISKKTNKKNTYPKYHTYRTPLYIAAGIFMFSLVFFGGWKLFFDTSIYGTWGITLKNSDGSGDTEYTLTLSDNMTARFHNSGSTLIGRYKMLTDENGIPEFNLIISNYGEEYVNVIFDYEIEGNFFTGRTLKLTDRSHMLSTFSGDTENEKKTISGEEYNVFDFTPSAETYRIKTYDGFKADEKLLGTWLYVDEDTNYRYTFTFNDNGTFEQISLEREIMGSYKTEDGNCKMRYYYIGNEEYELPFDYSINNDVLKFSDYTFTRTDSKDPYNQQVN